MCLFLVTRLQWTLKYFWDISAPDKLCKVRRPLFKSCHLPSYCVTTNTRKARGRLSLHLRDPQQMQIMAHSGNWDSEINIEDIMTDWPILKARGLFVRCITFKQRHSFVFITSRALYVKILLLLNHLELYGSLKSSHYMLEGCLVVLGWSPTSPNPVLWDSASAQYSVK